jgi:hypothetical protein
MTKPFSTLLRPSESIEGPCIITSMSEGSSWEYTRLDGETDTVHLRPGPTQHQVPQGDKLTLRGAHHYPVLVTGVAPKPRIVPEVTLTIIG